MQRILIATSTGGHKVVIELERLLAVALKERKADVHLLLCDKFLPACLMAAAQDFKDQKEYADYGPRKSLCDSCYKYGLSKYENLGLPIHRYSELTTESENQQSYKLASSLPVDKITNFMKNEVKIGEHTTAGTLRYFAKGDLAGEEYGEKILRRYFHAGLLTYYAIERLIKMVDFDVTVFHHGIYIPQGIIGEVLRKNKIRVVNWNPAYRKRCFIFSHNDTYHHTLLSEPTNKWESMRWTRKMDSQLTDYLKSRLVGTKDWIWFHENPLFEVNVIEKELGIDFKKPTIGLLTNVMWDAQLHYKSNAFKNMMEWLVATIKYFKERKDLQLVIRVHPAEVRGTLPSRQKVGDELNRHFPKLPPNIFIIPPESNISTYPVIYNCNAVLIYGTKTGVELTSMGIPVIVAGEAWIRNKGITYDAKSPKDYIKILAKLPYKAKMSKSKILRAKKYAYHFFFRRMIPLTSIEEKVEWPHFLANISTKKNLLYGKDKGLDTICNGILKGTDFIYKAEEEKDSIYKSGLPKLKAFALSYHLDKSKSHEVLVKEPLSKYCQILFESSDDRNTKPKYINKSFLSRPIIFHQRPPPSEFLEQENLKLVWIPMWDHIKDYPNSWWNSLPKNLRIIAFSEKVYEKATKFNIPSLRVKYYLNPHITQKASWDQGRILFYWNRVGLFNKAFLERLCREIAITKLIFQKEIDPGINSYAYFNLPSKFGKTKVEIISRHLPKEKYHQKLEEANIYLAPRPIEGVGLTYLEALARGAAVLSIDAPSMNEYITHKKNGYFFKIKQKRWWNTRKATEINTNQNWAELRNLDYESLGLNGLHEHEIGFESWVKDIPKYYKFITDW